MLDTSFLSYFLSSKIIHNYYELLKTFNWQQLTSRHFYLSTSRDATEASRRVAGTGDKPGSYVGFSIKIRTFYHTKGAYRTITAGCTILYD